MLVAYFEGMFEIRIIQLLNNGYFYLSYVINERYVSDCEKYLPQKYIEMLYYKNLQRMFTQTTEAYVKS